MIEVLDANIPIKYALQERIRKNTHQPKEHGGLAQTGDDIWYTDTWVKPHCDNNHGLITFGLVLLNDRSLTLVYDDILYAIPVGTVFKLDGTQMHAALPNERLLQTARHRFAFLAWDIPENKVEKEFGTDGPAQLLTFAASALRTLDAW